MNLFLNNFLLNGNAEREYFSRSNEFLKNTNFTISFLFRLAALAIRDSFDIIINKKHYKKVSTTSLIKQKSVQLLSKYGPSIVALSTLGILANRALSTKVVESVANAALQDGITSTAQTLGNTITSAASGVAENLVNSTLPGLGSFKNLGILATISGICALKLRGIISRHLSASENPSNGSENPAPQNQGRVIQGGARRPEAFRNLRVTIPNNNPASHPGNSSVIEEHYTPRSTAEKLIEEQSSTEVFCDNITPAPVNDSPSSEAQQSGDSDSEDDLFGNIFDSDSSSEEQQPDSPTISSLPASTLKNHQRAFEPKQLDPSLTRRHSLDPLTSKAPNLPRKRASSLPYTEISLTTSSNIPPSTMEAPFYGSSSSEEQQPDSPTISSLPASTLKNHQRAFEPKQLDPSLTRRHSLDPLTSKAPNLPRKRASSLPYTEISLTTFSNTPAPVNDSPSSEAQQSGDSDSEDDLFGNIFDSDSISEERQPDTLARHPLPGSELEIRPYPSLARRHSFDFSSYIESSPAISPPLENTLQNSELERKENYSDYDMSSSYAMIPSSHEPRYQRPEDSDDNLLGIFFGTDSSSKAPQPDVLAIHPLPGSELEIRPYPSSRRRHSLDPSTSKAPNPSLTRSFSSSDIAGNLKLKPLQAMPLQNYDLERKEDPNDSMTSSISSLSNYEIIQRPPSSIYKRGDMHEVIMLELKSEAIELDLFSYLEYKALENPDNTFLTNVKDLLESLKQESFKENGKRQYSKSIGCLREALKHHQNSPTPFEKGILQKLEKLAYLRFTGSSFYGFLNDISRNALTVTQNRTYWNLFQADYIEIVNSFPSRDEFTFANFARLLKVQNEIIKDKKNFDLLVALGKASGASGVLFDPQSAQNIPYPRSWSSIQSDRGENTVYHLRHSTVTEQDVLGNATSVEDYDGFLREAARKYQRVGYFNLQDQSSIESERVRAIKGLEDTRENFHVWSLPFDGKIFTLVKNIEDEAKDGNLTEFATMEIEAYKKLLIDEFFIEIDNPNRDQPIRFSIPKFIKDDDNKRAEHKEDLKKLLDHVHSAYFTEADFPKDEPIIQVRNRRLMVLFFYAHLVDFMTAKHNLKFVVTACKDNKDRGGAMTAICEIIRMIRTNQHNDPLLLEKLFTHVLGVGILTKNEEILEHRIKFLLEAVEFLSEMDGDRIKKLQESLNEDELGKVTCFGFRGDVLRQANPLIVESKRELFNQLDNQIHNKIEHTGSFDPIEFDEIFDSYSTEGKLDFEGKIKSQLARDMIGLDIIIETDENSDAIEYYNSEDVLKALELPENLAEVDPIGRQKDLEFLVLMLQSSGIIGSKVLLQDSELKDSLAKLGYIITGESGSKENTHLVSRGTFKTGEPRIVVFENRYLLKNKEGDVIARIPFNATYNLTKRQIHYSWHVEAISDLD